MMSQQVVLILQLIKLMLLGLGLIKLNKLCVVARVTRKMAGKFDESPFSPTFSPFPPFLAQFCEWGSTKNFPETLLNWQIRQDIGQPQCTDDEEL